MCYDMKQYKKRGLVYIIVNERFGVKGFSDRLGAYTDYKNMKKLFKPMGFKLMTFYDKTAQEIQIILKNASKRPDLAERPCFFCIISSHGEQVVSGGVGSDSNLIVHTIVGVDGKRVKTDDLVNCFSDSRCRSMAGKPKVFFIQACRESVYSDDRREALDPGVNIQYVVSAKLSKHRRLRQRVTGGSVSDSADCKLQEDSEELGIPSPALNAILGGGDEEDGFSDGYDTATTDEESDEDEDREKDHEDIRKRDRSSYNNTTESQSHDVIPEGVPSEGIKHIEAVTPDEAAGTGLKDQADAGKKFPADRKVDTDIKGVYKVMSIPCHDDMLVMFASPPGKLAWRGTQEGGWLLANLYNVMKHYVRNSDIKNQNLLNILVEVAEEVSRKETNTDDPQYNGMKMVPVIHHKLTKDVVLCTCKETGLLIKLKEKLQAFILS